ncbi:hypothetical protein F2P81_021434 [Scophthalmus maximus]|uniref:Uncharacterized protein n=1 Tax=Scophthalmus maximus TaxID=52904 RepID=A0A6A4S167_SCOMX|nr:hypothetical protein F2P81_021434 [Scophthalmus maximus]
MAAESETVWDIWEFRVLIDPPTPGLSSITAMWNVDCAVHRDMTPQGTESPRRSRALNLRGLSGKRSPSAEQGARDRDDCITGSSISAVIWNPPWDRGAASRSASDQFIERRAASAGATVYQQTLKPSDVWEVDDLAEVCNQDNWFCSTC